MLLSPEVRLSDGRLLVFPNEVVFHAQSFLEAPYSHQGRSPKTGLDCIGVPIVALLRAGYFPRVPAMFARSNYKQQADDLDLIESLAGETAEVDFGALRVADLLLFQWPRAEFPGHVGVVEKITASEVVFIHAHMAARKVVRSTLRDEWGDGLHSARRLRDWIENPRVYTSVNDSNFENFGNFSEEAL